LNSVILQQVVQFNNKIFEGFIEEAFSQLLISTAVGGTSKLLFTCRKSVYKEASKLRLFITENIVDLQCKDNQLTETEKMAICQYHCKSKDVKPDLYTSLSFTKANHMFCVWWVNAQLIICLH
jgi:hypothetical protein